MNTKAANGDFNPTYIESKPLPNNIDLDKSSDTIDRSIDNAISQYKSGQAEQMYKSSQNTEVLNASTAQPEDKSYLGSDPPS